MTKHITKPVTLQPKLAEELYLAIVAIIELAEVAIDCPTHPVPRSLAMIVERLQDVLGVVDKYFEFE